MNIMNCKKANRTWLGATFSLLCLACTSVSADLEVTKDKDNVVSSRLEGRWVPDATLNKHLGANTSQDSLEFRADESAIQKIPEKYAAFLDGRTIYMAGIFTAGKSSHTFILIEVKGNPHIVYFLERDGDPLGNAESFNVMLPVADESSNDMLFVGGDFNNQAFSAYKRVNQD